MDWNIIGHQWAVDFLAEQFRRGEVRHAYLFCGPPGVGRRTLALRFIQSLNCLQPPAPAQPCNECRICKQILRMQHPDLFVVQAEEQGGTLKVEQIRDLQHKLALHPYEARYRVALLLRFEEAHPSAMNALLKTLEEPASQVLLVLTAESPEILLPTIVSRCEVLRLRPEPLEQVSQGLQERCNIPAQQAELIAHISGGRPGYALRLFQEPERLAQRQKWLDQLDTLLEANRAQRFAFADLLSKDKLAFRIALNHWLSFWRDILIKSSGASAPINNSDRLAQVEKLAALYGLSIAHQTVAGLQHTLDLLEININARLAADVLMLNLPGL